MSEWKAEFLETPNNFYKWMGVFMETFERLRNIGKPTIARLNGIKPGQTLALGTVLRLEPGPGGLVAGAPQVLQAKGGRSGNNDRE